MPTERAIEYGQEAVLTCLTLAAPILIVGIAIAVVMGILQSMTQVQDQTVSFVPKIVVIALTFLVCLPWCTERLVDYSREQLARPKFMVPLRPLTHSNPQIDRSTAGPDDRTASNQQIQSPRVSSYR